MQNSQLKKIANHKKVAGEISGWLVWEVTSINRGMSAMNG